MLTQNQAEEAMTPNQLFFLFEEEFSDTLTFDDTEEFENAFMVEAMRIASLHGIRMNLVMVTTVSPVPAMAAMPSPLAEHQEERYTFNSDGSIQYVKIEDDRGMVGLVIPAMGPTRPYMTVEVGLGGGQ